MSNDMSDNATGYAAIKNNPYDEILRLMKLEGTPEQFLRQWLETVCRFASLDAAAVLGLDDKSSVGIRAIFPDVEGGSSIPQWLGQVAGRLGRDGWPAVYSFGDIPVSGGLYGQGLKVFVFPLDIGAGKLLAVFLTPNDKNENTVAAVVMSFSCLLHGYAAGRKVSAQEKSLQRFRKLFGLQSALRHHSGFHQLAMAICGELAAACSAERVSLGVLCGHFVKCLAVSHTEKLNRKMQVIRQLEQAMEESVDQQHIVIYPSAADDGAVTRMAEELSRHQGAAEVIAIPVSVSGEPKIVILLEFSQRLDDVKETLEIAGAVGEIEGPRLYELYLHSRWFGARAAHELSKAASVAVGSKHTWLKLGAIAAACILFWAVFFKGDYEIESPLVLEAVEQRVVAAPFESYLVESQARPGDYVQAGKTLLGKLDDGELRQQLASQEARRATFLKRAAMANREGKTAEAQVELSQAKQAQADIELLKYRLSKVNIVAPASGYVVSEDMGKQLGRAFKTGDVLFEIAAVDSLRAVIRVDEEDVSQLAVGQHGEFAILANPSQKLKFTIERIHPAASVVERKNVFEVWAKIEQRPEWLRPGLEGEAHIFVGQRRHIWIWTHRAADWVRMKLWQWL